MSVQLSEDLSDFPCLDLAIVTCSPRQDICPKHKTRDTYCRRFGLSPRGPVGGSCDGTHNGELVGVMVNKADLSPLSLERLEAIRCRLEQDVDAGRIPGATIALGSQDGVTFERTVGVRDPAKAEPLRPDAIWRIFSMTKPLVIVAAMAHVEKGLLQLDQPVADFIPSFGRLRLLQEDGTTMPVGTPPTIRDLMRHTAGLSYGYVGDSPAQRAYLADGFLFEDLANVDFVDRLAALPLEYEPATTWHYSHSIDVLGRVLEVLAGKDLSSVLTDDVLGPLDMIDTAFQLPVDKQDRVAQPLPVPFGTRSSFFDPVTHRRHQSAGGGLVSTVRDYSRFLRMMLGQGTLERTRLLSPAAVKLMTSDHLGTGIRKASYYPPGPGYGFGLGVAVRLADGDAFAPGSRGDYFWSGVGGTYFWVDPHLGFFAIFMLQSHSPQQRAHYRGLIRNMVYAARD